MIAPQRREDFTHAATTSTRPRPCVRHCALFSRGISRRGAIGTAIGVQQHLVVGALDGAIARRAIAADDADTGVARGARAPAGPAGPAGPRSPGGPIRRCTSASVKARCTGTSGDRITISTKVAMKPDQPENAEHAEHPHVGRRPRSAAEATGGIGGVLLLLGSVLLIRALASPAPAPRPAPPAFFQAPKPPRI